MSVAELVADFGEAFDELREEFLGAEAKVVLLREEGKTKAFDDVVTVTSGWWSPKYSEFFGNSTFQIADVSQAFANQVRKASHLMVIDSAFPALNNTLHELASESAPPDSESPWWKLRAKPLGRKYIAEEEI